MPIIDARHAKNFSMTRSQVTDRGSLFRAPVRLP